METIELMTILERGEDSRHQFKKISATLTRLPPNLSRSATAAGGESLSVWTIAAS
jgi:hypothetical protein